MFMLRAEVPGESIQNSKKIAECRTLTECSEYFEGYSYIGDWPVGAICFAYNLDPEIDQQEVLRISVEGSTIITNHPFLVQDLQSIVDEPLILGQQRYRQAKILFKTDEEISGEEACKKYGWYYCEYPVAIRKDVDREWVVTLGMDDPEIVQVFVYFNEPVLIDGEMSTGYVFYYHGIEATF